MWQDLVFAVGSVVFLVALLPAIFGRNKPPLSTSLLTGSVLAVYAWTQATLGLDWAAGNTALLAGGWGVLALQAFREWWTLRRYRRAFKKGWKEAHQGGHYDHLHLADQGGFIIHHDEWPS